MLKNNNNFSKLLGIIYISITGYIFWFTSRYPQLSGKAISGVNTELPDLNSFDLVISHSETYGYFINLFISFLNWGYTNWKGMLFGILLAVGILTVLYFINLSKFSKNRFIQSIIGLLQGFGLGVCVNCVTPIGKSLLKAGVPKVSVLATMVTSPSLNIISFSLIFSLFPWFIALGKILFSLFVILILIPFIFYEKNSSSNDIKCLDEIKEEKTIKGQLFSFIKVFFKNSLYILKTTVPLMFLGGFLGVLITSMIPLESLGNLEVSFFNVLATATVGFLLPVPMFFDIIFSGILFNTPVSSIYSIILLLTLGGFSIYPLMILYFEINRKKLFIFAFSFIISAVAFSYVIFSYKVYIDENNINNYLSTSNIVNEDNKYYNLLKSEKIIKTEISEVKPVVEIEEYSNGNITLYSSDFVNNNTSNGLFKAINPSDIGIQKKGITLGSDMFQSITAGDYNNDGWQDLFVSNNGGVQIYKNVGGRFEMIGFDLTDDVNSSDIVNIFLVDLDGDTFKDLFITTRLGANYIFWNDNYSYSTKSMLILDKGNGLALDYGVSIGDLYEDNNLDIFIGQYSLLNTEATQNYIYKNIGNRKFIREDFTNIVKGPTLFSFIYDFDGDDKNEIYVGNDFNPSDVLYDVEGEDIYLHDNISNIFPSSPTYAMNIAHGDIDNDLNPEYFITGHVGFRVKEGSDKPLRKEISSCNFPYDGVDYNTQHGCDILENVMFNVRSSKCNELEDEYLSNICIEGSLLLKLGTIETDLINDKVCKKLENSYYGESKAYYCRNIRRGKLVKFEKQVMPIPEKSLGNVFLKADLEGNYKDISVNTELENTGWTLAGIFEDLDNNGWIDLYLTNGHPLAKGGAESNVYFSNNGGNFQEKTKELGLINMLDTIGVLTFDFDNDGDLDLFNSSRFAQNVFFINESGVGNSIFIDLEDRKTSNSDGIGAEIIITDLEGNKQLRDIFLGGTFMSYGPLRGHFGLGNIEGISEIEIKWPDGEKSIIKGNLKSNKKYKIVRK